jgi:hypothetical protein
MQAKIISRRIIVQITAFLGPPPHPFFILNVSRKEPGYSLGNFPKNVKIQIISSDLKPALIWKTVILWSTNE